MDPLNNILKQRLGAGQTAQSAHPSTDTLAAFAEQSLKAQQRETVLEHLAVCSACREAVTLAASEVPAETAPALSRKPVLQFPAAMRWASLAAALAVAVGVGLLWNQHELASRPTRSVDIAAPVPPAPTAAKKPKSETANSRSEVKSIAPEAFANRPALLIEKKKPIIAAARERANLSTTVNGAAMPRAFAATAGVISGQSKLSNDDSLSKDRVIPTLSNQESNQEQITAAAKPSSTPAAPVPAAEAVYGQTSNNISGAGRSGASRGVARTEPVPASASQTLEVLQGAVTDESGAVVAGAEVTITDVTTGIRRVVKSGPDGGYRVDSIPAGIYKIEVASPGFTTATAERVETLAGAHTTENFQLKIGSATETVAVSSEAPPLNSAKTDIDKNLTTGEAPVTPQGGPVQIPSKVSPAAAVPGSFRRMESAQFRGGLVHWAISDNGQLQRSLKDGATTNVQPAPGMIVRAVAAEGIEVWAAGTQPDLSAKEWTQRSVLFHSSDAGKTWSRVDGPWQGPIIQLSLSGKGNLTVFTSNGMWITSDAGKSWFNVKTKG